MSEILDMWGSKVIAFCIGTYMVNEYSLSAGLVTFYGLWMLIDIRDALQPND